MPLCIREAIFNGDIMNVKGVIFDMDGLMFDTEILTYKIWREVLGNHPDYTLDFYKQTVGKRSVEVVKMYQQKLGADFDYQSTKVVAMEKFWDYTKTYGVSIKAGLFELLEHLKSHKIKIALATSTTTKSATEILARAGVLEYFDTLVCGDMVSEGKPHPEVYATAVEKLGLTPTECLALEDSFNGIISSTSAGIPTVMVPDLIEPTDDITAKCYKVVKTLNEVIKMV